MKNMIVRILVSIIKEIVFFCVLIILYGAIYLVSGVIILLLKRIFCFSLLLCFFRVILLAKRERTHKIIFIN